jgi:hypothetical protein
LRPFFVPNPAQDPPPMAHLAHNDPYSLDIELAVAIKRLPEFNHSFSVNLPFQPIPLLRNSVSLKQILSIFIGH